jgi:hypothetical protein
MEETKPTVEESATDNRRSHGEVPGRKGVGERMEGMNGDTDMRLRGRFRPTYAKNMGPGLLRLALFERKDRKIANP